MKERAERGQTETIRTLFNNGVRLSCTDHGAPPATSVTAPEPPPLLLLHGLAGYAGEWSALARLLRPARRVVAYDARGHGDSERRPADLSRAAHVHDALAVMDEFGIDRPVLVAQSLGGLTALLTAASHPDRVRGLVMIEAGAQGLDPGLPGRIGAWLDSWPVPFASLDAATGFFGGGPAGRAWAEGLAVRNDGLYPKVDRDVMVACVTESEEPLPPPRAVTGSDRSDVAPAAPPGGRAYWDAWDSLRCPVLVVRGGNGWIPEQEVAEMCARQPGTRSTVVRSAGHDVHLDQPAQLHAVIADFLAALPR
jgi:pimeloyl-ACP methyl ester carboxylesterase